MKMIYKIVGMALCISGLYAEVSLHHEYIARINDAIDQRDVEKVDKLLKTIPLSLAEKERFLASARRWVEFYEHKTKSWFKSGNDLAQFLGGSTVLGFGLALLQQAVSTKKGLADDAREKKLINYLIAGSLGINGLGLWLISRGWRKVHAFTNLSQSRRILEILETNPVS